MFILLLLLTLLTGLAFLFFTIKRKERGKRPMAISGVSFLIVLIGLFIVGGQPATSDGDYREQASTFGYDRYVSDSVEPGTPVKITGDVLTIDGEFFILETDEGAFYVKNSTDVSVQDGETLTVFGGYSGKDDTGSPAVNGQFIER